MKSIIIYLFIMQILFFSSTFLIGSTFPKLIIKYDKKINKLLSSEPDPTKENPMEFHDLITNEIGPNLNEIYKDMWQNFNSKGQSTLPWCIYEVVNDLKQKESIVFWFSIGELNEFPTGRIPIRDEVGIFDPEYKRIWIIGLWKKWYMESMDSEKGIV